MIESVLGQKKSGLEGISYHQVNHCGKGLHGLKKLGHVAQAGDAGLPVVENVRLASDMAGL